MIAGSIRRRRSPLLVAFALLPLAALMRCSDVASCPNCIHSPGETREPPAGSAAADAIRLEAIKYRILSKLGLKQKPDVSRALPRDVVLKTLYRAEEMFSGIHHHHHATSPKPPPQPAMEKPSTERNEDDDGTDGQEDDFYGRTREIITFAEQGYTLNGQKLVEFSASRDGDRAPGHKLRVKTAALWVRVDFKSSIPNKVRRLVGDRNLTLWVFQINRLGFNSTHLSCKEFDEQTQMSASLSMKMSQLGWQKLDLTATVRTWYSEGDVHKLRLLIDCSGCSDFVKVYLFKDFGDKTIETGSNVNNSPVVVDPNRPFLIIHTDPEVGKRVRRRALDCSGALKGQCCKQRFYVSFQALGWDDWIIAPHGYFANYCRGDCGGTHRTPDTYLNYYTHVIEEYRKMDKISGMQPCCAPVKFSSMSLIYFGPDSNIIKRDLPKMVVDECGCP